MQLEKNVLGFWVGLRYNVTAALLGHVIRRSKLVGEWIREVVAVTPNPWRAATTVGTWCGTNYQVQGALYVSVTLHLRPLPPAFCSAFFSGYTDSHRQNSMIEGNGVYELTSDSTELPITWLPLSLTS
ncbi:hypothetical protein PIB30_023153 [Stylosanthes scabra]|uniref:Uncharacterized protein n=1 Tax=Stylosanthes scabra TaxID=79078 RepID=A0ABU6S9N5_9FABA|nr:hypothetical protein [Stylosanthes scabra]